MEDHNNILESNGVEENDSNKDQKLEPTKVQMGEAKEENGKLKLSLEQVVKDYQTKHAHLDFIDITKKDKQEEVTKVIGTKASQEDSELVSLSLGISSKGQPIMDEKKNINRIQKIKEYENLEGGLALGLNTTFDPSATREGKEEELSEKWPPSKVLKTTRTGDISEGSQHTQLIKKARVCIRARCDTQTMNDGCQWRKYGQKMAKGNPCPRAYYRCTVSPSCPVRKQVQRCAEDMSILITTYEGSHNHPLPTSATSIAYTTSAAASMLQCPSSSSQQGLSHSDTFPIVNSSVAYNLNSLNYTSTCQRPQQLYFQNSPISSSNSHPTVTLDLTTTTPQTPFYLGKFTPAFSSSPKHSSTNLNFPSTMIPLQSSMLQSTWSPYSSSMMNNGKQPFQGHIYQHNYYTINHAISQQPFRDSIVATNKAIKTNPKFRSALAAALTTYVGTNGTACDGIKESHVVAESAALNLKLGGDIPSRYLSMSKSTASNAQKGNMFKFPPS